MAQALMTRGYSQAIHDDGWSMALRLNGFTPGALLPTAPMDQQEAMAYIDAWDEPNFRLVHDILDGNFPVQSAYLFADQLAPAKGPGSLGTVGTFIDRAVALRDGTDAERTAIRDQDRAAMARLAERLVFTPAIEDTLQGKIAAAKTLAPTCVSTTAALFASGCSGRTSGGRSSSIPRQIWKFQGPARSIRSDHGPSRPTRRHPVGPRN